MKELIYLQAINEAIREEMSRDEKVFVIGEDVQASTFGVTRKLVQVGEFLENKQIISR